MRKLTATLAALLIGLGATVHAQVNVTIDNGISGGFMSVSDLPADGGGFVFADNWGFADLSATFTDASTLVLRPNTSAYETSPDVNFWRAGGTGPLGNKQMTASSFAPANALIGEVVTFEFVVDEFSFTEHTVQAFIRAFDAGFGTIAETVIDITATGYQSLTLDTSALGAANLQYGFVTVGINASAANVDSYGIAQFSAIPEPSHYAMMAVGLVALAVIYRRKR